MEWLAEAVIYVNADLAHVLHVIPGQIVPLVHLVSNAVITETSVNEKYHWVRQMDRRYANDNLVRRPACRAPVFHGRSFRNETGLSRAGRRCRAC